MQVLRFEIANCAAHLRLRVDPFGSSPAACSGAAFESGTTIVHPPPGALHPPVVFPRLGRAIVACTTSESILRWRDLPPPPNDDEQHLCPECGWGLTQDCCHPRCRGMWGNGCWHCHSRKFHPLYFGGPCRVTLYASTNQRITGSIEGASAPSSAEEDTSALLAPGDVWRGCVLREARRVARHLSAGGVACLAGSEHGLPGVANEFVDAVKRLDEVEAAARNADVYATDDLEDAAED